MLNILQFTVSNDPTIYECHPDLTVGSDGNRLIAVFTERTHHWLSQSYSRIVCCISDDHGRTWTGKRALTEGTDGLPFFYDAPRIANLNGRLCVLIPRIPHKGGEKAVKMPLQLIFSEDNGKTWSERVDVPLYGIAPDKPLRLENGRIIIAAHHYVNGFLEQFMIYSDDDGKNWSDHILIGRADGKHYCEVSILPLPDGKTLVAFMRENSRTGDGCKRSVSRNNGETWSTLPDLPLPGCYRPVAGRLNSGRVLLLWVQCLPQQSRTNTFGTVFDIAESAKENPETLLTFPLDHDRSPFPDTGYTGWHQFPDGEICCVNYIADDAGDCAQIRAYLFRETDILLPLGKRYLKTIRQN